MNCSRDILRRRSALAITLAGTLLATGFAPSTPRSEIDPWGGSSHGVTHPDPEDDLPATPLVSWSFDHGFEDWRDGRGAPEFGFTVIGQGVSTQALDPRRGWTLQSNGHQGGALGALRMNGATVGHAGSPLVKLPAEFDGLRLDLWYRWSTDGEPGDRVKIELYENGRRQFIVMGQLRRDTRQAGAWRHFVAEIPVVTGTLDRADALYLDVYTSFRQPLANCTATQTGGAACDFGFAMDDITISTW